MKKFFVKYKDFFSIDFGLLLLTFFFLSNIFFVICIIPIFIVIFDILLNDVDQSIVISVILCFLLSKFLLPIIYHFLENKSKNYLVQKIISELKTNWKYRLITLIIVSICPFSKISKNVLSFINVQIFCSGFISFLILFLWWDIQKLIKRSKANYSK